MVNEEAIIPKKKKKKRADGSVIKKKKKLPALGADGSVIKKTMNGDKELKKKKKKKKIADVSNSTLLLNRSQTGSDNDLFSSQSPIKAACDTHNTPPPSPDFSGSRERSPSPIYKSPESSPEKAAVLKCRSLSPDSPPVTPLPAKKFATKSKIKKETSNTESPSKKRKLYDDEAAPSLHPLHPDVLADLVLEEIAEEPVPEDKPVVVASLSDPLLSQQDQDLRDFLLLTEVKEKFGDVQEDQINWNSFFVFNMLPEQMAERFKVLMEHIPRKKPVSQLTDETIQALVRAKVRNIPASSRNYLANRGVYTKPTRKVMNALTLFTSRFDQATVAKDEIRERWELLDNKEKSKLRKEAKILNNANGIQRGVTNGPKKRSGYQTFAREQMKLGKKLTDVGAMWSSMTTEQKGIYNQEAEVINRDRMASAAEAEVVTVES